MTPQAAASRRARVEARNFMIGLFMPSMSGGWTVSRVTDLATHRYQFLRRLALIADANRLDYVFMGGGFTPKNTHGFRFRDRITDAISLAAAFGAVTTNPMVIATIHLLYRHAPLFIAKLAAGIDEVSAGGFGINVVCGLSPDAPQLFDIPSLDHDERYGAAAEFVTIMKRLWSEDLPVNFDGRYYRTHGAFLDTKPVQRPWPLLVNAGFSEAGKNFAAQHCDWIFIISDRPTDYESVARRVADIKSRAAREGRNVKVCMHPYIICRETEAEVQEVRDLILRNVDEAALERQYQAYMGPQAMTQSHRQTERVREDFVFLGTFQIFGTPSQVTDKLIRLRKAGCDGVHLVFFDWENDLKFFCDRVLPALRSEMGDVQ
jgi:alkanesulfonate monooxygenase SsuD/methylene tetrahydromethanopterin reductase-like flavin-dependent oxidoreductase (luciferase family)